MVTEIRYFGVSAFEITNARGTKVFVDPYLDDNPVSPVKSDDLQKVDLILVTHAAYDHLGDTAKIAKRFGAPVVCGADVRAHLIRKGIPADKLVGTIWGLTWELLGIRIRCVESRHWSSMLETDGTFLSGPPLGYLLYSDPGVRIYHSGDTTLFSDLRMIGQLYRPTVGMLNVSDMDIGSSLVGAPQLLTGEMTPYEACLAAQWLGLEYVIPMHYAKRTKDVDTFVNLLSNMTSDETPYTKPIVLSPGEIFRFEGK